MTEFIDLLIRCWPIHWFFHMQPNRTSTSRVTPIKQFTGRKIDAARDFRVQLGDYVQATVRNTDNTMSSHNQGCIALRPTGNLTGSVNIWCMATNRTDAWFSHTAHHNTCSQRRVHSCYGFWFRWKRCYWFWSGLTVRIASNRHDLHRWTYWNRSICRWLRNRIRGIGG